MSEHMLIAANHDDAMSYAWDPRYTIIKYVGDNVQGYRMREASFTPRATVQPHWMDTLQEVRHSIGRTTVGGQIHYLPLYDTTTPPQEGS